MVDEDAEAEDAYRAGPDQQEGGQIPGLIP